MTHPQKFHSIASTLLSLSESFDFTVSDLGYQRRHSTSPIWAHFIPKITMLHKNVILLKITGSNAWLTFILI